MRRGIPCMERIPTLIRPLELTLRVGSQTRTIIATFCDSCFSQGAAVGGITPTFGTNASRWFASSDYHIRFWRWLFRTGRRLPPRATFGTNAYALVRELGLWNNPSSAPSFAPKKERPRGTLFLERKTGLEPATFGLGSRRSTIEPLPHGLRIVYNFLLGLSIERRQNGHKKEKRRPELQPDDVFMV